MTEFENTNASPGRPGAGDSERGSETVETAILFSVLILVVFGVIQGALWFHARDIAHSAASTAYFQARLNDAGEADGTLAGHTILDSSKSSLNGSNVAVTRSATTVTVTVTGTAPTILSFLGLPQISETVTGPVERFTSP